MPSSNAVAGGTDSRHHAACDNMLRLLPEVLAARETVIARTMPVVRALAQEDLAAPAASETADYALLHHLMLQARQAAEQRDRSAAAGALAMWRGRATRPRQHGVIAVEAASCARREMAAIPDPVYCLTDATRDVAGDRFAALGAAWEAVDGAGFRPLCEAATGVVIDLGPLPADSSPVSFTLSFLPATAALEWPSHATGLGELLVHEAAHAWLNESLAATGATLPTEPLLPSPWKGVPRPPVAILHAAFAFATVACYLRAATWPAELVDHRDERCDAECQIIAAHRADIDTVIATVPDRGVRDMVSAQVALALS